MILMGVDSLVLEEAHDVDSGVVFFCIIDCVEKRSIFVECFVFYGCIDAYFFLWDDSSGSDVEVADF